MHLPPRWPTSWIAEWPEYYNSCLPIDLVEGAEEGDGAQYCVYCTKSASACYYSADRVAGSQASSSKPEPDDSPRGQPEGGRVGGRAWHESGRDRGVRG